MAEGKAESDKLIPVLSYVIWLVGLIVFLVEKEDKFKRYHALQATVLGIIGFILGITLIGPLLVWLYSLYLAYQVYTGADPRPLAKYIEKYV